MTKIFVFEMIIDCYFYTLLILKNIDWCSQTQLGANKKCKHVENMAISLVFEGFDIVIDING